MIPLSKFIDNEKLEDQAGKELLEELTEDQVEEYTEKIKELASYGERNFAIDLIFVRLIVQDSTENCLRVARLMKMDFHILTDKLTGGWSWGFFPCCSLS